MTRNWGYCRSRWGVERDSRSGEARVQKRENRIEVFKTGFLSMDIPAIYIGALPRGILYSTRE